MDSNNTPAKLCPGTIPAKTPIAIPGKRYLKVFIRYSFLISADVNPNAFLSELSFRSLQITRRRSKSMTTKRIRQAEQVLLLTPYNPSKLPKPDFKQRAAFRRRYS